MSTRKEEAIAARQRRLPCDWCGEPIVTMHKTRRYCAGRTCQEEAKAERSRQRRVAKTTVL